MRGDIKEDPGRGGLSLIWVKNPPKCREGVQGKKRLQVKKIPAQDGSASSKIRQNSEKPDKSKQPM